MKKQDNKGFTLVELLVAIMVLAIVIVPMLHGFVTSHRVNAKSKQMMRATALAQNEMEIFEKEKIEDLMTMTEKSDPSKLRYTVTDMPDPTDASDDGCYTFERKKTINDESGREMFDVVVTLNPKRMGAGDRYYDFNIIPLMQMNTISNLDSGSYVQTIRSENNATDYDSIVYGTFKERRDASGVGAAWELEDFEKELIRKIRINVSQVPDGSEMITKAKVTYEYTCEAFHVMPAGYETYTEEKVIYDNAQERDDDGNRIELKSIYLFYAPRYGIGKVDEIIIENEAKLPIDFYVIRQDIWQKADVMPPDIEVTPEDERVWRVPLDYQAAISIYDGMDGANTYGKYWTNLNINDVEIEGNGKQIGVELYDVDTKNKVIAPKADILTMTELKNLGQAEAKDHIYTMEVKVYKTGADPSTEAPLVTMTGSKME